MTASTSQTGTEDLEAAPLTLRFTEWQCGHHSQRPEDIPVHSVAQAQLILQAIANAIGQPGHARATLFDEISGTTAYLSDDYAETLPEPRWQSRSVVYYGSADEIVQLQALRDAFEYAYGGSLTIWNGQTWIDDLEVITTLSVEAINAAIQPVAWYEQPGRNAVCDVPPVLKPAGELLQEMLEVDAELRAAARAIEQGCVA